VWAVPHLCKLYPGICLATAEKARKNLCHGSTRVPVSPFLLNKLVLYLHTSAVNKISKLIQCSTSALLRKGLNTFFIAHVSVGNWFSWPAPK
jgi:hypothetical protein